MFLVALHVFVSEHSAINSEVEVADILLPDYFLKLHNVGVPSSPRRVLLEVFLIRCYTVKQISVKVLEFPPSAEVGVGKPRLWVIGAIPHNPIGGIFLSRLTSSKSKIITQTCLAP